LSEEGKAYDLKHKLLEYFERKKKQVPIAHGSLHSKSSIDPIPGAVYDEDPVYIRNAAGNIINPSTEETLAGILAKLDVALSSRASESSLVSALSRKLVNTSGTVVNPATEDTLTSVLNKLIDILAKLDVALSTRASESSLTSILSRKLTNSAGNVINPSTEDTLASILAKLDVALSSRASEGSLTSTLPRNITQWSGTPLTGRDISLDLAKLSSWDEAGRAKTNIATASGTNIIIDKLTQYAFKPDARTYNLYTNTPPDSYVNLGSPRGIFWAHGCRGIIRVLNAWLKNVSGADQTITVSLRPYPGGPAIVSADYTIPNNTDGWLSIVSLYNAAIKSFYWNYDSLALEFSANSNVSIGIDNDFDVITGYVYFGGGWYKEYKLMGSLYLDTLTVGDIPVSGTVNTIHTGGLYSYTNITTATTTVVKSGSGFLHAITVNGGTLGNITIYDNTAVSGTRIATLDTLNRQTYFFDVVFKTGLTIVTAAATNITVSYI
jgi:hypothetical protein